jgi:hypothetical protein
MPAKAERVAVAAETIRMSLSRGNANRNSSGCPLSWHVTFVKPGDRTPEGERDYPHILKSFEMASNAPNPF